MTQLPAPEPLVALSSELIPNAVEQLVTQGADAERLRSELTRLQRLRALRAPGYHELVDKITEQEKPTTKKR